MNGEIEALIRLLDDEEPLAREAGDALVAYGAPALPLLRELADRRPALAATLTRRIEAQMLEGEWAALARCPDAEAAAILLARWLDPLVDERTIRTRLDTLAEPLDGLLPPITSVARAREGATLLRDWLAGARGYRGNSDDYYAPENSLLPHVLESKSGLPLTLSLIYLFVARRLEVPLQPIGLPRHLIVRYGTPEAGIFLDPFHKGALMTEKDCRRWIAQQGIEWRPAYLNPISDHTLIERMLRNLVNAYALRGDERAVAQTVKYFEIWTDHHAG